MSKLYLSELENHINTLRSDTSAILHASRVIADSVTNGGSLYFYDSRNIVSHEVTHRAGGLAIALPLRAWEIYSRLTSDDVVVVFLYPVNGEQMGVIKRISWAGCKLVGVFPKNFRKSLRAVASLCDVLITNDLDTCEGTVQVDGFGRVGPMHVIVNSTIAIAICVETANLLLSRGRTPTVYMTGRTSRASEYNRRAIQKFENKGY